MHRPIAFAAAALLTGAALAAAATPASAAPDEVQIKDAAAVVTVVPSNRSDVEVVIARANPRLPLKIERRGDHIVVDGDLRRKIKGCNISDGRGTVGIDGVGQVAYADLPQIIVRTPMRADIGANGAVFGSIGRTDSLDFGNAGCGDWKIANVAGKAELSQAGSGDLSAGSAGSAEVSIAGSGNVALRSVANGLEVSVAGSGDVTAETVNGQVEASIAGSGDVDIRGGRATKIDVSIAGSGDVRYGGAAQSAEVAIMGSGDVTIGSVAGPVSRSVMGSGSLTVLR